MKVKVCNREVQLHSCTGGDVVMVSEREGFWLVVSWEASGGRIGGSLRTVVRLTDGMKVVLSGNVSVRKVNGSFVEEN